MLASGSNAVYGVRCSCRDEHREMSRSYGEGLLGISGSFWLGGLGATRGTAFATCSAACLRGPLGSWHGAISSTERPVLCIDDAMLRIHTTVSQQKHSNHDSNCRPLSAEARSSTTLEDPVAEFLVSGALNRGGTATVDVDGGDVVIR